MVHMYALSVPISRGYFSFRFHLVWEGIIPLSAPDCFAGEKRKRSPNTHA